MVNIIATLILVAVVGSACYYIYKEKKKGTACIGCPMAGDCAKAKAGGCAAVDTDKR
ncbi:MAG: FeoB-associated Cys-rich membrane protein [Lachnospiraceae bacterium]|nr:FeoB-associated Cys-rich membrane protein [Lachnospiraceae bacterium]